MRSVTLNGFKGVNNGVDLKCALELKGQDGEGEKGHEFDVKGASMLKYI